MKKVNFEPISRYVWVYHVEEEAKMETTKSGLITSMQTKKDKNIRRVVAAVGELCDPAVKKVIRPGDTILFENMGREPIEEEGQEFNLVQDNHILCKTNDARVDLI